MKNLLIFLFGVGVGFGGAMVLLHKEIKEELENIKIDLDEGKLPFEVDENGEVKKKEEEKKEEPPVALRPETRTAYHNIVKSVENGEKPTVGIPVMPREDAPIDNTVEEDEIDGGIYEIDMEEFRDNPNYEKRRYLYYRGDRIMATEYGTIIPNPFILVGGEWEQCVGNYSKSTAFIRNTKLLTDYEIKVEDGLYQDEYGIEDNYRED